jgi:hypothetical protein
MTLTGNTFRAVANSTNGTLNTDTTVTFVSEDESSILGVYRGGTIRTGNVVATRKSPSTIEMLYHCVTTSGELKAAGRWGASPATRTGGYACTSTGNAHGRSIQRSFRVDPRSLMSRWVKQPSRGNRPLDDMPSPATYFRAASHE